MENNNIKELINTFANCDIENAAKYFILPHNDSITNEVRAYLDNLDMDKITQIKDFLSHILNVCYDYKLFDESADEKDKVIKNLNEEDTFLLKETAIYFIGRLKILPDMNILKKAYYLENNKHIMLNLAFASLATFDEEIELDFISKFEPGNEYDTILRSWTMAFFANSTSPYTYKDSTTDNWEKAKMPRLKRLAINEETNAKFNKAMSFRLMDLLVLYLFLQNRKETLNDEEKEIVKNANIEYYKFSTQKKDILEKYKSLILNSNI